MQCFRDLINGLKECYIIEAKSGKPMEFDLTLYMDRIEEYERLVQNAHKLMEENIELKADLEHMRNHVRSNKADEV